jgi:aryl-alcohol dehydrogenase-like predicted oxidoreductase
MGMSAFYGSDDEKQSIATLERAIELGVTFWDTAQMYGWGANEELLGRVLAGRRDQVVIASKFGVIPDPDHPDDRTRRKNDGSPANVRRSVDAALRRLGADHIDLYYQHRPDPDTPVEETAGALAEQIQAGKIRYYGLSEVGPELVRRAHATYPLTAVQSEYSLWTRENVEELLPVQRELGIGHGGVRAVGPWLPHRPVRLAGGVRAGRLPRVEPAVRSRRVRAEHAHRRRGQAGRGREGRHAGPGRARLGALPR